MNKLTRRLQNIENKLNYDHMVNGKSALKNEQTTTKEYRRDASIIKSEYLD